MYVSNILPDEATIVYPERGCVLAALCSDHSYASWEDPPTPPPQLRRGGRAHPPDERVVCKPQSGRWSSLLPVGTVVRRPSVKLVQLVAQAIHESPHRVLRVTQVYAALQNRYPYYRLLDTKSIRSWKMPGGLPWLFLPTDDEGEQRGDEASTLSSGLHVNTEQPSKTTATLMPSAFRLELEYTLFAPPEPQSPGDKHKLSTLQCSELAPVTSAAQSEDDLVSVGSPPSSLPHIAPADLWKSPSMNPVGWPAPGRAEEQAWQQPSVSACAAPPSLWDGMYFQPAGRLGNMLRGSRLLSADDECFAFVNVSWGLCNNLTRLGFVMRSVESSASGERRRIAALVVAPPPHPRRQRRTSVLG
ncbi:hypothetical protein HPB49_022341 [Dermacentor silvarum]|uniref:Uncharacterized protein n=1 Tax=Dermacentor silvarum TaxID=543639 RepID=A0ACB8DL04_DERSI|nr:hypothetical protein HPB49_022341 [Dermacentor silvarum]